MNPFWQKMTLGTAGSILAIVTGSWTFAGYVRNATNSYIDSHVTAIVTAAITAEDQKREAEEKHTAEQIHKLILAQTVINQEMPARTRSLLHEIQQQPALYEKRMVNRMPKYDMPAADAPKEERPQ